MKGLIGDLIGDLIDAFSSAAVKERERRVRETREHYQRAVSEAFDGKWRAVEALHDAYADLAKLRDENARLAAQLLEDAPIAAEARAWAKAPVHGAARSRIAEVGVKAWTDEKREADERLYELAEKVGLGAASDEEIALYEAGKPKGGGAREQEKRR